MLTELLSPVNGVVQSLNNSKFFAGLVMIVLNIGSRYIQLNFSKSQEEYLRYLLGREVLIFSVAWMGSRDIYKALTITLLFSFVANTIFHEDSNLSVMPEKFKKLEINIDENNDGTISDIEINKAISILEKAKKQESQKTKEQIWNTFMSGENFTVKAN